MSDYREKPLICVDLDGTLAQYDGWKGENNIGEPIPGAAGAMLYFRYKKGFTVCVFTTRGNKEVVVSWLNKHNIVYDYINDAPVAEHQNPGKPPAKYFIDDRAIRFEGSWTRVLRQIEELDEIEMTRNGAAYHQGIGVTPVNPSPQFEQRVGYAPEPVKCWCGKYLITCGMPDFLGAPSEISEVCTVHYECPVHGQFYEKPMGIGISGKAGSGKDTLAVKLKERLGWPVVHFADELKKEWFAVHFPDRYATEPDLDIIAEVNRMKLEDPDVRQQLIGHGMWRRDQDPLYWVKKVDVSLPQIIADTRFVNEANFLQSHGFLLVRIECMLGVLTARGYPPLDDESEDSLDNLEGWDIVIINNAGKTVLEWGAEEILTKLQSVGGID